MPTLGCQSSMALASRRSVISGTISHGLLQPVIYGLLSSNQWMSNCEAIRFIVTGLIGWKPATMSRRIYKPSIYSNIHFKCQVPSLRSTLLMMPSSLILSQLVTSRMRPISGLVCLPSPLSGIITTPSPYW